MPDPFLELAYSAVADEQLDQLEDSDPALYDRVMQVCEEIGADPTSLRRRATVIATPEGARFRVGIPHSNGVSVFWSDDGGVQRIEAVFPWSPSAR